MYFILATRPGFARVQYNDKEKKKCAFYCEIHIKILSFFSDFSPFFHTSLVLTKYEHNTKKICHIEPFSGDDSGGNRFFYIINIHGLAIIKKATFTLLVAQAYPHKKVDTLSDCDALSD